MNGVVSRLQTNVCFEEAGETSPMAELSAKPSPAGVGE
jgi:hypothetical protein